MGRFLSEILHEPSPYVLLSGQGTLVAPLARREVLYPKFPPQKSFYALGDCAPNFQPSSIFHTKTRLTLRKRLNSLAHSATQM